MAKITLSTIFDELQKTNSELQKTRNELRSELQKTNDHLAKIDAKNDDRFELIKQEFASVRSDIDKVNDEVKLVRKSVDLIAIQTTHTIDKISSHEQRIKKLEGPNA